MKYAELLVEWLQELGYTHCFFVAGGNCMHLLDGARQRMECVAFIHEVGAGIAAEYFNECGTGKRAFVLVTAGPGLTNLVTALAGAHLESRELLVLGGQVKTSDLAGSDLRQRGIQEVDGVAIARPVTVASERFVEPPDRATITELVLRGREGRPGPVFLEFPLDVQGAPVEAGDLEGDPPPAAVSGSLGDDPAEAVETIRTLHAGAERPVWLLGGGVRRDVADRLTDRLRQAGVPLMTTWNGADRVASDDPLYFGRPNTWGMRYSNVLLQQADLVVALGTRLGLQQTGFNWQEFVPLATLVQIDIDPAELCKGHPKVDVARACDANAVLDGLCEGTYPDYSAWVAFCDQVRSLLPVHEEANVSAPGFIPPYEFALTLSDLCTAADVVIPCSSGGAFTILMQAFRQKAGQLVITDKGLASMGYGLSGAVGAALANRDQRTILVEGDGGFSQNLQELATVAVNGANLKIFLFANEGYASIRMTQRNYFGGAYLGCDTGSGLGFPDWLTLFKAYGIPAAEIRPNFEADGTFRDLFDSPGPAAFVVPVDPEATYFPKISSRVTASGSMESQPLHLMSPDLPPDVAAQVFRYLPGAAAPTEG